MLVSACIMPIYFYVIMCAVLQYVACAYMYVPITILHNVCVFVCMHVCNGQSKIIPSEIKERVTLLAD